MLDYVKTVIRRKFPKKESATEKFLMFMSYEYVYTPQTIDGKLFDIRDVKDYPVLYIAIVEDIDVLVTGDKDFADIDIEKPEIMTPSMFMDKYL